MMRQSAMVCLSVLNGTIGSLCVVMNVCYIFFFFQAEDGIRDLTVTGVQTCALPICVQLRAWSHWHDATPSTASCGMWRQHYRRHAASERTADEALDTSPEAVTDRKSVV